MPGLLANLVCQGEGYTSTPPSVQASPALPDRLVRESHGQDSTCRWWRLGLACLGSVVLGAALLA
jgi:hypothetical protein